jgi:hypothetical protein
MGWGDVVKRVLLTGMSRTGKSTRIVALAARGYKAVDADAAAWSRMVPKLLVRRTLRRGIVREWRSPDSRTPDYQRNGQPTNVR